jgi:hypothetical protein
MDGMEGTEDARRKKVFFLLSQSSQPIVTHRPKLLSHCIEQFRSNRGRLLPTGRASAQRKTQLHVVSHLRHHQPPPDRRALKPGRTQRK